MDNTPDDTVYGKAEIVSKFNFMQEVWFLDGLNIRKRKIISMKGEGRPNWGNVEILLEVHVVEWNIAYSKFLKEEEIFESREALVHRVITL